MLRKTIKLAYIAIINLFLLFQLFNLASAQLFNLENSAGKWAKLGVSAY
jgi:hypothetical protein